MTPEVFQTNSVREGTDQAMPEAGESSGISAPMEFASSEVHVWKISLDSPHPYVSLSPDEQIRADHYDTFLERRRFIASRASVRLVLGHYLHIAPECVEICYTDTGRPFVPDVPLDFTLSHSEGLSCFACALHRIGIDVERLPQTPIEPPIIICHPQELIHLPKMPHPLRAFFKCWCRKEACLKAEGIIHPIDVASVCTLDEAGEWRESLVLEERRWYLSSLEVEKEWVAELASSVSPKIRYFEIHW